MAVGRIDANIQGMISGAQLSSQKEIDKDDVSSDAAKKAALKKIQLKKSNQKQSVGQKETFTRNKAVDAKIKNILGGSAGAESANAMSDWQGSKELQGKLTSAQKDLFKQAMAKNPPKATKTAQAQVRMAKDPAVQKAVTSSQQMGVIQKALIEDPGSEKAATNLVKTPFMQSPKGDKATKGKFLEFGMRQAGKGDTANLKKAGDMLGTMTKSNVGRGAQQAGMSMVQRNPENTEGMDNVDSFMQQPSVAKMPTFARGKATELLSKADGKGEVKESFEKLSADPKFKGQTAQNKGRMFSTIGTGRPSEFRQISDSLLGSLQTTNFPKRSGQVGKFLSKVGTQVKSKGAKGVDTKSAMKSAKSSPMPKLGLIAMDPENMSDEELAQARSQNRGNVMQFFNQVNRMYEKAEKKLNSAQYLEDVNALKTLRAPEMPDTSSLTPEEQQFVKERGQKVKATLARVKNLQKQKSRELRGKRMPPAKRRAKAAARRAAGKQPKYFNPNAGKTSAAAAFSQPKGTGATHRKQGLQQRPGMQKGLPKNTARAQIAQGGAGRPQPMSKAGGDIGQQVQSALAQMGEGPLTPQMAGQVAQTIAQQVAQSVAQQVTEQLMAQMGGTAFTPVEGIDGEEGGGISFGMADEPTMSSVDTGKKAVLSRKSGIGSQRQQGDTGGKDAGKARTATDGWGIPRAMSADLGGTRRNVVKAPQQQAPLIGLEAAMEGDPSVSDILNESYSGRMLVKDPTAIRDMGAVFSADWKGLSKAEQALLKNLGWSQQNWSTKDSPAANWPMAMATGFLNLNPTQREAVRKLGQTPHDWDTKVQAFTAGQNA